MGGTQINDALVGESIRRGCMEVDKMAKKSTETGSTAVSLFLLREKGASHSRVFCSNIGDSRCIMLRSYDMKEALSKSVGALAAGGGKPMDKECKDPASPVVSSSPRRSSMSKSISKSMSAISLRKSEPSPPTAATSSYFTAVHLMSEDHKLSVLRERIRVKSKSPVEFRPLPADASSIFLPEFCRTLAPAGFLPMRSLGKSVRPMEDDMVCAERERPLARTPTGGLERVSAHYNTPTGNASRHGGLSGTTSPRQSLPTTPEPSAHGHSSILGGRGNSLRGSQHGGSVACTSHLSLNDTQPFSNSSKPSARISSHGGNSSSHGLSRHGSRHSEGPVPRSGVAALADSIINPELSLHSGHSGIAQQPVEDLSKYHFIFDWGYAGEETEGAARTLIRAISAYAPGGAAPLANEYEADDGVAVVSATHRESFISQRMSTNGETAGPEAVFSRFNNSIVMTRSVGDLYGPRSCVCVPEVSAYSVPDDVHARFVVASDGVWDVLSIEEIRCVGMSDKLRDAKALAQYIAQKAQRRRDRGAIRNDDITVVVVDINPDSFLAVNTSNGGHGLSAGGDPKCAIC